MEKILKNLEPSVRAYLGDAFCFSIINDVAFDSGWVYDKYIHIEYTPCDGQIKYADYDYYDFVPDQGVFIKSFIEYPYEYCNQEIICNQIIGMIDNDEYCFALWDETVITNHLFGENQDKIYEHGCFVYGYDTEKKVFLTQGYFNNEKWEHYSIPYHVFYQAISYCPEKGEIALIGYKVRTNYEWKLDYDKVRNGLKLYKKNSFSKADRNVFDLNSVVNFFSNLYPGIPVHDPSLYCIYEHKIIFYKRLVYLNRKGWHIEKHILEMAEELCKKSRKVMLLGIAYNKSLKNSNFKVMLREAGLLTELEKNLLYHLNM